MLAHRRKNGPAGPGNGRPNTSSETRLAVLTHFQRATRGAHGHLYPRTPPGPAGPSGRPARSARGPGWSLSWYQVVPAITSQALSKENAMTANQHPLTPRPSARHAVWRAACRATRALRALHNDQLSMWEAWWQANRATVPEIGPLTWVLTLDGHRLAGLAPSIPLEEDNASKRRITVFPPEQRASLLPRSAR